MKRKRTTKKQRSDFKPLDAMCDPDIDVSDIPPITPEQFAKAVVRKGIPDKSKQQLTMRLDADVIAWFKNQGSGYQTRMNELLRAYMPGHQKSVRAQR